MTRATAATVALGLLLALTAATWWLGEGAGEPAALVGVAVLKIAVIGAVFLELDRAWPGWAVVGGLLVGAVAGGVAWLI